MLFQYSLIVLRIIDKCVKMQTFLNIQQLLQIFNTRVEKGKKHLDIFAYP